MPVGSRPAFVGVATIGPALMYVASVFNACVNSLSACVERPMIASGPSSSRQRSTLMSSCPT